MPEGLRRAGKCKACGKDLSGGDGLIITYCGHGESRGYPPTGQRSLDDLAANPHLLLPTERFQCPQCKSLYCLECAIPFGNKLMVDARCPECGFTES